MNIFIIHQSHNDSYKNHQMVKELFPGDGKVLFQKLGNKITVLTDIPLAPEFKDNFEIENRGNVKQPADCIPFSIRLNPVKANKRKRYPIREEEIEEWVNNKLSNLGFEILYKTISKEGIDIANRKNSKCYHVSVLVSGFLKVTDWNKMNDVVCNGIGHGKCFGFGMLNIFC